VNEEKASKTKPKNGKEKTHVWDKGGIHYLKCDVSLIN
jgi:hypothetical protein